MKKLMLLITIMFLFVVQIFPQDWPLAPEVWSEPVKLDSVFDIPYNWVESPSLTKNFDTLYFDLGDGVYTSIKHNNKWCDPIKLNSYINPGGAATHECSISRDGKRLYVSGWGGYGGWDIWKSETDTLTNDWGPAINMGPEINSEWGESYLFEVNQNNVFLVETGGYLKEFVYNDSTNKWIKLNKIDYHHIGGIQMMGVSLPLNLKKMYFGHYSVDGEASLDISVCYWDSTTNFWGNIYSLNIDTKIVHINNTLKRGAEYYPWISEDGKTMVFSSNRDVSLEPDSSSATCLYITYLLIDENGDTVTTVEDKADSQPKEFTLQQNYPNPFNPNTTISFSITTPEKVSLKIYDILGNEIATLINSDLQQGSYTANWNATGFSSGVYFYQLHAGSYISTKKMSLIK